VRYDAAMRILPQRWRVPALLAIAAVVANAGHVRIPIGGDDAYIIPNLLSPNPLRFLFAFHYDAPSDDFMPWYMGVVYQRRFLRLPACALLAIEARLFGGNGFGYHAVTLLLVIATLLVVYRLFRDGIGDRTVACVALLPVACHPAAGEIVSKVSCQPIAFAGLFSVLAVQAWVGWRRTERRTVLAASLAAAFIAMTSYEGAVVLPLLVVIGDLWLARDAGWRSRIAMLALIAAYLPAAGAARFDLVHPETQPMRPLGVVLECIRIDGGNYLLKLFGLYDTNESMRYALYNYAGEVPALAIALSLVALVVVAARRMAWALLGAAAFITLLAPPLLMRAAVARLNVPSLRQLYLPLVLGASVMTLAIAATPSARRLRFTLLGAFAAWLLVQDIRASHTPFSLARESIGPEGTLAAGRP
jgi:hypothetical protein